MDEWEINKYGEVVNRIENKNEDSFHVLDKDGNRVEGKSLSFEYGTVEAQRNPKVDVEEENISKKEILTFEIKGGDNAKALFEFMANPENTVVEWTHAKIGTENSGKNIVGTSYEKGSTHVGAYLRSTGYTLREVNHNHPSGNSRPSLGDLAGATQYHMKNSNTLLQIYTHHNRKYTKYDQFSFLYR